MTREEAKSMLEAYSDGWFFCSGLENLIDEIYDHFEQCIAELEAPKTCDGCEYQNCKNSVLLDIYCGNCNRNYVDYYEPKEPL